MRLAVIGCGYWGPNVARAFARETGTELVAVVDLDEQRREQLAEELGVPSLKGYEELEELDAVAVCTPADTHHDLVAKLLEAELDVFVEKPLTLGLEDAEDLAARVGDRIVMVDHLLVYHPAVELMKQHIDEGVLGQVLYGECIRSNLGIVRKESSLWSLAPHDLAVMVHLFGYPEAVSAESFSYRGGQDQYEAELWWDSFVVHMRWTWLDPEKRRAVKVVGEDGALIWDDVTGDVRQFALEGMLTSRRPTSKLNLQVMPDDRPLDLAAKAFRLSVESREKPLTDVSQGVQVVRLLHELEESAHG